MGILNCWATISSESLVAVPLEADRELEDTYFRDRSLHACLAFCDANVMERAKLKKIYLSKTLGANTRNGQWFSIRLRPGVPSALVEMRPCRYTRQTKKGQLDFFMQAGSGEGQDNGGWRRICIRFRDCPEASKPMAGGGFPYSQNLEDTMGSVPNTKGSHWRFSHPVPRRPAPDQRLRLLWTHGVEFPSQVLPTTRRNPSILKKARTIVLNSAKTKNSPSKWIGRRSWEQIASLSRSP